MAQKNGQMSGQSLSSATRMITGTTLETSPWTTLGSTAVRPARPTSVISVPTYAVGESKAVARGLYDQIAGNRGLILNRMQL